MLTTVLEMIAPHLSAADYWKVIACLMPLATIGVLGLVALFLRLMIVRFRPDLLSET